MGCCSSQLGLTVAGKVVGGHNLSIGEMGRVSTVVLREKDTLVVCGERSATSELELLCCSLFAVAGAAADMWHWCLRGGKAVVPRFSAPEQQQQNGSSGHVLGSQPDRALPPWRQERQQLWQQQRQQQEEGGERGSQQQQQQQSRKTWRSSSGLGSGKVWRNLSIHLGFAAAAAAVYLVTSSSKPNSKYTTRGRSSLVPWRQ